MSEQAQSFATGMEIYTSAGELASVYQANAGRILELVSDLESCVEKLRETFGDGDFRLSVSICGADKPENFHRELKRTAWRTLIGKLGIERIMSSKRREELRDALRAGGGKRFYRDGEQDPVELLPEISPESIHEVLQGYAVSADEFLDEAIHEEYEWLKPWSGDKYKTNEQNRWKIGKKVIITGAVERYFSGSFHPTHYKQSHLQAIDSIFHLLDGKSFPKTHSGPLCDAISGYNKPGAAAETEYFRFKCYKNGSLHLEFKRLDLVAEFNFRCGNKHELPGHAKGGTYCRASKTKEDAGAILAPGGDYNFFETPICIVKRMVESANLSAGDTVLEPSAGLGRIAHAVRAIGADVICVEAHADRARSLKASGLEVVTGNFLEMKPFRVSSVIMNPPFTRAQDVMHIQHAWDFVGNGGSLVAIASSGVKYRSDKRTSQFREWLASIDAEVIDLPEGAFSESGTEVSTVMIVARKPDGGAA